MIAEFQGEYRFLSNFWPCTVWYDGLWYPSVEHAYVASKTTDKAQQLAIQKIDTAGKVKRFGRQLDVRADFEPLKIGIMFDLVAQKFTRNEKLKNKLLDTGTQDIVEGNKWGDVFWGVCNGKGQNHLGKILMQVRSQLQQDTNQ